MANDQTTNYNPFIYPRQNMRVVAFGIGGILYDLGWTRNPKEVTVQKVGKVEVPEVDWNPYVVDVEGNKHFYQRDYVWTLEQKQALIENIYRGRDCGKVVIRKHSWEDVEAKLNAGEPAHFKEVIDGKQRLLTLLAFVNNEFPDKSGHYFKDFSRQAAFKFEGQQSIAYLVLDETATDLDAINAFLDVNIAGIPVDDAHIYYVQKIRNILTGDKHA